jgi:Tol biopolymer transport system component
VPPLVRTLLQSCLVKDPRRRVADISTALFVLDKAASLASSASPDGAASKAQADAEAAETSRGFAQSTRRRVAVASAVALLAGAIVATTLMWFFMRPGDETPDIRTMRFQIVPPEGTTFRGLVSVSPDGEQLAFTAAGLDNVVRIWVHSLESSAARPLAGTEGVGSGGIFWSPDSRFIGFTSQLTLKKVDVSSGTAQTICILPSSAAFRGGAWSNSGTIVFGTFNSGLWSVSDAGGSPVALTTALSELGATHSSPTFLPDGRHFLYSQFSLTTGDRGIYLGSLDISPAQQSAAPLVPAQSAGVFYAPHPTSSVGHILFEREGSLMAQPFDSTTLELAGQAAQVAPDLASGNNISRSYSASNGLLVYAIEGSGSLRQLLWFDRQGMQVGQIGPPGLYDVVRVARDGKTVVAVRTEVQSGTQHTWIVDVARDVFSRLSPGEVSDNGQAISPDGRVAYSLSAAGGAADIYSKLAGGVDAPELLAKSNTIKHSGDWSRDGRFLIYDDHHLSRRQDLWIVALQGDRKPIPFLVTPADETFGQFSPDGRWVAYDSDESGQREVYVRGFAPDRNPATSVGQWQISPVGGSRPRWSRDGRELFYIARDGKLMAVPVTSGTTFVPGIPVPLFDTRVGGFAPYDVTPDGRFLINTIPEATASPIGVVLNWQAGLR